MNEKSSTTNRLTGSSSNPKEDLSFAYGSVQNSTEDVRCRSPGSICIDNRLIRDCVSFPSNFHLTKLAKNICNLLGHKGSSKQIARDGCDWNKVDQVDVELVGAEPSRFDGVEHPNIPHHITVDCKIGRINACSVCTVRYLRPMNVPIRLRSPNFSGKQETREIRTRGGVQRRVKDCFISDERP